MDLHQTVQDLAEAWVAASTDTSFSRTQLQVYGSQEDADGGGEPSTSSDADYHNNPVTSSSGGMALQGGDGLSHSHSRKRKQSSPQPLREGGEAVPLSTSKGDPPPTKKASTKESDGKLLPVHCIVELLDTPPGSSKDKDKEEKRKTEGYAIVPSSLQLRELVRVALSKLEYPAEKARNATGVMQVRNWKPLPFSAISDNQQSTVGQLFGDLLSHITLKISILSSHATGSSQSQGGSTGGISSSRRGQDLPLSMLAKRLKPGESGKSGSGRMHSSHELRVKLLQLLEKRGPTLLVSHGCPFSQATVSQILQGKYTKLLSMEKVQAFYQWYNIYNGLTDNTLLPPEKVDSATLPRISSRHWRRPRTLFNPRSELPRLLRWYRENPRPSRAEMEVYLAELNSTDFRRHGTPLQYSSIVIWFKNARVKYRHLLKASAIAQMQEDVCRAYSPESPDKLEVDENEEVSYDDREDIKPERRTSPVRSPIRSPVQSPVRSPVRSPARSPARSPVKPLQLKQEPVSDRSEWDDGVKVSESQGESSAPKPLAILPSLLHMQAKPHLQPVSLVGNGLIVPSRLPNGYQQPETALQVPDLRKIASGFGISLNSDASAAAHIAHSHALAHGHIMPPVVDVLPKDGNMVRLEYHNGSLTVPKPTPHPLANASTSNGCQQTATSTQQTHKHGESSKQTKPSQSTSNQQTPVVRPPRKRFTIDPTFEVPKLQSWFAISPRPDRQTIERYVQELNSSEWRRHQPKYNNRVVYVWFKNARAKHSKMQSLAYEPEMDSHRPEMIRMQHVIKSSPEVQASTSMYKSYTEPSEPYDS